MFELVKEVELKIDTGEKVESFKLKRRRIGKKENKAFKKWAKEQEKKNAHLDKLAKELNKKSRKIEKLNSSLEDIKTLLKVEDDKEKIKDLIREKRIIENKIEALENELEKKQEELEELEDEIEKIQEAAVLKSFELLIVQDDEAVRLKEFAKEYGINLGDLLVEINKQIDKESKKK